MPSHPRDLMDRIAGEIDEGPPPCIHSDLGLCPKCRECYLEDPMAYWEYGDHPAGIENMKRLMEEIAKDAAEREEMGEPNPDIPF